MTYEELLERLKKLSPEELQKPVVIYDQYEGEMLRIHDFRLSLEEETVCSGINTQHILTL